MPQTVKCPKCNAEIDVEAVIGQQIEEKYQRQYQLQLVENEKVLTKKLTAKIQADYDVELKAAKERADESARQLKEFKQTQLENERLKRQLDSQRQDIELELEKKFSANEKELRKKLEATLKTEAANIAQQEAERNAERIAELQKQLNDARKAAEDAVRKAEQRSQQLQGEIQELAIEEFLKASFPFDAVNEVRKGQYGADVVQTVRNSIGQETGTMLYESKNTEAFNRDWLDKLKVDAADARADMLILVTKTMPKGSEHTEFIDGVWVCPMKEFQGTARVLRESLLRISEAYTSQTNKESKMQLLYDYLTNGKFVAQIKQVIDDFRDLRDGYEKEKAAMLKIWKKRDAQIEAMMKNTTNFVTQIQVIAGSEIPQLLSPEEELLALDTP